MKILFCRFETRNKKNKKILLLLSLFSKGKIHHADAVSSSAGALKIVKLYVQIKMWSVQDKNKDGHLQHRLISGLRVEVCLV
jgi:hypothetical protein